MTALFQHRVRYHEVDQQGFLFNARFLEIADVALVELFRDLGFPYENLVAQGTDPSVVNSELTFSAPARFDDMLDARVAVTHVGNSSFVLVTTLHRGDLAVATVSNTYVNVDTKIDRSRALPSDVADALRARMHHRDAASS